MEDELLGKVSKIVSYLRASKGSKHSKERKGKKRKKDLKDVVNAKDAITMRGSVLAKPRAGRPKTAAASGSVPAPASGAKPAWMSAPASDSKRQRTGKAEGTTVRSALNMAAAAAEGAPLLSLLARAALPCRICVIGVRS